MNYETCLSPAKSTVVPMNQKRRPGFVVREMIPCQAWVIDAVEADGSTEQLLGVFTSAAHARDWIAKNSDRLKNRNA